MKKIGIFWGSSSGNTEIAIEFMKDYLEAHDFEVDSYDIGEVDVEEILNYDKIYVMDKGIVVDSGNHEDLLNVSEIYKNFYYRQINLAGCKKGFLEQKLYVG